MKTKLSDVKQFTSQKSIAVAGVSHNPKKFGNEVYRQLQKMNYEVYPVNPTLEEVEGVKCYSKVSDLPESVTALHINTKPVATLSLVKEAYTKGIMNVWIQQGAGSREAFDFAKEKSMNVINGKCILMFAGDVKGPHKFHGFLSKVFGTYPR